jgi:hypothetical protein
MIALLADIHGNREAMSACLADAAVALEKVYSGQASGTRIALDWFNPFTVDNRGDRLCRAEP